MSDTIIWIAQGFLALFFLATGLPKMAGRGMERWTGFDDLPRGLTLLIGVAEVASAVALVLPLLVDRYTWTTPLAALGIAVIALMASGFHVRGTEWLPTVETALWGCLAAGIAIARWDQLATGPSISQDVLVTGLVVLVPAIVLNLVVLFRSSAPAVVEDDAALAETR